MYPTIEERLTTPILSTYDVIVCGGGTAGVVAALASARNGANTLLVENYGFLGGSMINGAGPLHSFFNCYKAFDVEKIKTVRGIADEIIERMISKDGCLGHLEQERGANYDSVATIIDWEKFKDIIFTMMTEAGVNLLLHTQIVGAMMKEKTIDGIIVENKSGRGAYRAKCVIDCTGDADVCHYAGANAPLKALDKNAHISVGMPFGMSGVDMAKACAYLEEKGLVYNLIHADKGDENDDVVRIGFELKKLAPFGDYMNPRRMWGPLCVSRTVNELNFINMANVDIDNPLDAEQLTKAEIELRHQVMEIAQMMIDHLPGFENACVNWTPIQAGVRRTRIVDCEYDITMEDIVSARKFEDDVAVYGFHDLAPRQYIKDGGYFGIPYRALLPKGVEGLLVAGRSITTDWVAHMSTRNTVSCMAQGQAVGTAAALCAKQNVTPRALPYGQLREQLLQDNVFLG